jgi:hypothetical protein
MAGVEGDGLGGDGNVEVIDVDDIHCVAGSWGTCVLGVCREDYQGQSGGGSEERG